METMSHYQYQHTHQHYDEQQPNQNHRVSAEQTQEQKEARERMALFPASVGGAEEGEGVEVLFVKGDIWVVSYTFRPFSLEPSKKKRTTHARAKTAHSSPPI